MNEGFTIEPLVKNVTKSLDDVSLWERFKEGDKTALSIIYHLYYSDLFTYGLKVFSDADLTEDSIQDVFFILWKNKDQLDLVKSVKAYLFKAFRRRLIRHITGSRKGRLRNYTFTNKNLSIDFSIEDLLIREEASEERNQKLLKAMNALSPRQKEIMYLRFYKELSYDEIAEIIPLNYQSIRNCVHTSVKVLRKTITTKSYIALTFLGLLSILFHLL